MSQNNTNSKIFRFTPNPFECYMHENILGKFDKVFQASSQLKNPSLFSINDGYILGNSNLVSNKDNQIVVDGFVFSFAPDKVFGTIDKNINDKSKQITFNFSKEVELDPGFFIGGYNNIGHWLFNHLAKLVFYKHSLEELKFFISDVGMPTKFIDYLRLFGIRKEQIVFLNENTLYKCHKIYHPLMPWHADIFGNVLFLPQAISFLRDKLVNGDDVPRKNIYIPRKNSKWRKILNEDELVNLLLKFDFDIIYPEKMSLEEQINIGGQTKTLLTGFGAAVNFFIFMQRGTNIIQLSSKDRPAMNILPYQAMVSGINCFETKEVPNDRKLGLDDDYHVNIANLEKHLKDLLS
jgi:capsular polysaccharide biosynthesis protein